VGLEGGRPDEVLGQQVAADEGGVHAPADGGLEGWRDGGTDGGRVSE
jgi:hypothetical protein